MYNYRVRNNHSKKNFTGSVSRGKPIELNFMLLNLHQSEPGIYENINSLKEYDLLVLVFDKTAIKKGQNVKRLASREFLQKLANKEGMCLAMVNRKRAPEQSYVELRLDLSNVDYLESKFRKEVPDKKPIVVSNVTVDIHFFDSMSTRLREYRTIRCAEFYEPHARYIIDPTLLNTDQG